jgi:hypothetical protein
MKSHSDAACGSDHVGRSRQARKSSLAHTSAGFLLASVLLSPMSPSSADHAGTVTSVGAAPDAERPTGLRSRAKQSQYARAIDLFTMGHREEAGSHAYRPRARSAQVCAVPTPPPSDSLMDQ